METVPVDGDLLLHLLLVEIVCALLVALDKFGAGEARAELIHRVGSGRICGVAGEQYSRGQGAQAAAGEVD